METVGFTRWTLIHSIGAHSRISSKGKGKVYPRTGREGPEGEVRYSSTLFLTSALDGGGWSTPCPGRFTPGKDPVPTVQEAGCAQGRSGRVRKISPPPGFDPQTVQPVASRYTDGAIPARSRVSSSNFNFAKLVNDYAYCLVECDAVCDRNVEISFLVFIFRTEDGNRQVSTRKIRRNISEDSTPHGHHKSHASKTNHTKAGRLQNSDWEGRGQKRRFSRNIYTGVTEDSCNQYRG